MQELLYAAGVGCYRAELGLFGRDLRFRFVARRSPIRMRISSRSTSARPPRTAIISRPVLVPVQRFSVPSLRTKPCRGCLGGFAGEPQRQIFSQQLFICPIDGVVAFLQFRQLVWSVKRLSHDPLKQSRAFRTDRGLRDGRRG
jgi:hypothetical protein